MKNVIFFASITLILVFISMSNGHCQKKRMLGIGIGDFKEIRLYDTDYEQGQLFKLVSPTTKVYVYTGESLFLKEAIKKYPDYALDLDYIITGTHNGYNGVWGVFILKNVIETDLLDRTVYVPMKNVVLDVKATNQQEAERDEKFAADQRTVSADNIFAFIYMCVFGAFLFVFLFRWRNVHEISNGGKWINFIPFIILMGLGAIYLIADIGKNDFPTTTLFLLICPMIFIFLVKFLVLAKKWDQLTHENKVESEKKAVINAFGGGKGWASENDLEKL